MITTSKLHALFAISFAALLHVGYFVFQPQVQVSGMEAAGDGGQELVSLQAASASILQLVDEWERPKEKAIETEQSESEISDDAREPVENSSFEVVKTDREDLEEITSAPKSISAPPTRIASQLKTEVSKPAPKPTPKPVPKSEQPPQKKSAPSQASTAQKASGQGGQKNAGAQKQAPTATISKAQANNLRQAWGSAIRAQVERKKRYPSGANGRKGTAVVNLTVGSNGALQGVGIAKSSGSNVLDQAAVSAVKSAGKFPGAPEGLGGGNFSFSLPIGFQ